MQDRPAISPYN